MIDDQTRQRVRQRAGDRCEYCLVPQDAYAIAFVIDHILAQQHITDDSDDNLAFCCLKCNRKKGPNIAGIDPAAGCITPLYHPRRNVWTGHFRWNGALIVGTTPQGRATVAVLDLNEPERVRLRQSLIAEGRWPPAAGSPND